MVDLLELRAGVEMQAARYAAMRRTEEHLLRINQALERMLTLPPGDPMGASADFDFHLAVAAAAHNPEFVRFLTFLGQTLIPRQAMRLQADRFATHTGYVAMMRREHTAIAEAIALRDARGAIAAMDTHLTDSAERYRQWATEVAGERS
jgi:DNA-binding FadR family transcriptional regulator